MEKLVELIFEVCIKCDESQVVNKSPFYYDCDELFEQDSFNGLKIKKTHSLKAVDKVHRVNLMNHIAQKNRINIRYRDRGDLILVEVSDEKISGCYIFIDYMKIIENELDHAASFVGCPPGFYARNEFVDFGKKVPVPLFPIDEYKNHETWRWLHNIILDRLDQVSETERNYIINYFNSLLPNCTIKWKDNVLYVTC